LLISSFFFRLDHAACVPAKERKLRDRLFTRLTAHEKLFPAFASNPAVAEHLQHGFRVAGMRLGVVNYHTGGAATKAAALLAVKQAAMLPVPGAILALRAGFIESVQLVIRRRCSGHSGRRSREGQRRGLRGSGREWGGRIRRVSRGSLPGFYG
jgi:hypothetical protein